MHQVKPSVVVRRPFSSCRLFGANDRLRLSVTSVKFRSNLQPFRRPSSSSLAKFAAINKTRALGAKGRYRGGLAKRRTTNKRLVSRLAPTLDPLIVRGRMRRKRVSTGETVGRKMREPRAVRPGAPELIAHIRQVTALGAHRGMGPTVSSTTGRQGALSGAGCRTVSLTREG